MSTVVSRPRVRSAVAALALLGLAACGGSAHDQAGATQETSTSADTSTASTAAPTAAGPGAATTGAVASTGGAAVAGENLTPDQEAELQQAVDQGHQPWRTDPAAVAEAFAQASLGWTGATATPTDEHTVVVTDPASGAKVSLRLEQPVGPGAGGIWVVVGGTRLG
jgi:hypothetical protein